MLYVFLFVPHQLDANTLSGPIPDWINEWQNLAYLDLYNNRFSGSIPAALGEIPNLLIAQLQDNDFEGVIPSER